MLGGQSAAPNCRFEKIKVFRGTISLPFELGNRKQVAVKIVDALFDYPVFSTSDFLRQTGIPKQTAMPLVQKIRDAHILKSLREASGTVPAILVFSDLLNIAEGKKVL